MSEKFPLLRRPRPPKVKKSKNVSVTYNNIVSPISNVRTECFDEDHTNQAAYPMDTGEGIHSPVPTMQSDYEPYNKLKQQRKMIAHLQTDIVSSYSDRRSPQPHSLVQSYKPRGPDPFPIRTPLQPQEVKQEYILPDDSYYYTNPEFCLEDFLPNKETRFYRDPAPRTIIVSNDNYVKLANKVLQNRQKGNFPPELTKIDMFSQYFDVPPKERRVPKQQTMIEMEKEIRDRMEGLGLTSASQFRDEKEKVGHLVEEIQNMKSMHVIGKKSQIALLQRASKKVFEESQKSLLDDKEEDEGLITPTELAILNCLMDGGFILSLKAHFTDEIPDLTPLHNSLIYLNLSFNELEDFPMDTLNCSKLNVLKFRDNPMRHIPDDISRLKQLRTLVVSFCCLTSLPVGLCSIKTLEYLDVSYNKLSHLPVGMKQMLNLRFLNVEGNELAGLPCGLLRVNLSRIRIRNNYMSPVFWKENSANSPQSLKDICCYYLQSCVVAEREENYKQFTQPIAEQLQKYRRCDCCLGPLYGRGLRIIRPCTEIWKIRRLPFIFQSCSPTCYKSFIRNTDPKVADHIFGDPSVDSIAY